MSIEREREVEDQALRQTREWVSEKGKARKTVGETQQKYYNRPGNDQTNITGYVVFHYTERKINK